MAFPTVLRVVDSLIAKRWVREIGLGESNGGRRPQVLEIEPAGAYAIGVELGRRGIRMVGVDLMSNIVESEAISLRRMSSVDDFLENLSRFLDRCPVGRDRCLGIGVSVPGPLDPSIGRVPEVIEMPACWHQAEIVQQITDAFDLPTELGNDADAAALGEYWCGPRYNASPLLFVLIDVGIGAGLIHHGALYSGARNAFGEISHMVIRMPDSLENIRVEHTLNMVSLPGVYGGIPARLDHRRSEIQADRERWNHGDQEAGFNGFVPRVLDTLAVGLSNLAHVLDPAILVLGGERFLALPDGYHQIRQRYRELHPCRGEEIVVAHFGEQAVAVGAAALVLQQVFDATLLTPG